MKRVSKPVFFIVAILIFGLTYLSFFGAENYFADERRVYVKGADDIRWGIDIQGGVEAVFMPDLEVDKITSKDMDSAKAIVDVRLVNQNITDYELFTDHANKQLIVRFPWKEGEEDFDPAAAVEELGSRAVLKFCEGEDTNKVILEGKADIESASPAWNSEDSQYIVQLKLTKQGASKFASATARLAGSGTISIWMDEVMISNPSVNEAIPNGEAVISGNFTAESATDLANKINAGALPFGLTVDDAKLRIISPTFGANARNIMLMAGAIAFGLVCVMMLFLYRLPGFVACIALVGQVGGMIACVSGFFGFVNSFTLTIPGIAGIILSIGMGVDANVITSERIKEELRAGKTLDGAIDAGYDNGFSAIFDGNITVVIVSVLLMGAFGPPDSILSKIVSPLLFMFDSSITGSIYSFGFTLLMGVVFNFVMGVWLSRFMLKSLSGYKFLRKPTLYGGAAQ